MHININQLESIYIILFFFCDREPRYIDTSGLKRPWPQYDLVYRHYLEFKFDMTLENAIGHDLWGSEKHLWNDILDVLGFSDSRDPPDD